MSILNKIAWPSVIGAVVGLSGGYLVKQAFVQAAPVLITVQLIGHDAAGRVLNATAIVNALSYDSAGGVQLEYTSDQILCSGFGGGE